MLQYGYSPLRYPGGKGLLSRYIADIINLNNLAGGVYYELYAGGAGAALNLLFNNVVKKIVINDADYRIYAFWYCVLFESKKFIKKIDKCEINIEEWYKQKKIYNNAEKENILNVGFATFFLNRTNRSGILHKAGPIGGINQTGNFLINARFNKENLKQRLQKIITRKDDISLFNSTTEKFLQKLRIHGNSKSFFYLDPPYYNKGKELYLNNYSHDQHLFLSQLLERSKIKYWLVSYDNTSEIKSMYSDWKRASFNLNYSLQEKKEGSELLIYSDSLRIPRTLCIRQKEQILAVR